MKNSLFVKISAVFIAAGISLAVIPSPAFAVVTPVGGYQYTLAGAGINSTQSTIQLNSFKTPDGRLLTMAMFGTTGYGALEPQTVAKLEDITFSGVTQNANGTATLTGVTRGNDFITPYASSASLAHTHAGGQSFILTNTAGYYGGQFAMVNNPATISAEWGIIEPSASTDIATKNYVDTHVNGGPISVNQVVVAGTAGETVAAGNVIYQKISDGQWYKLGATTIATSTNVSIGIAEGAGTAGVAISNGVLLAGLDSNQSGLTAGAVYFAASTAGSISTATSTRTIGQARTTTSIYFNPTIVGPRSITANSVLPLNINGVSYVYPNVQATASSSVLTNDANGNLYWFLPNERVLSMSTTSISATPSATTSLTSVTIPAGIATTTSKLRITAGFSAGLPSVNGCTVQIDYGSGSATTTIAWGSMIGTVGSSLISSYMIATTTTSANWYSTNTGNLSTSFVTASPIVSRRFSTNDITAKSFVSFSASNNTGGDTCTLVGYSIELLTLP